MQQFNFKMFVKKHAPDICIGLGLASMVGGAVVACIETKKLDNILDEHKKAVDKVHLKNDALPVEKQEMKKELTKIYFATSLKATKLYLPAVLLELGGAGLIVGSHKELKARNRSLASAYATLDGCFKAYRTAVKEKYGEAVDTEFRYGIKKSKDGESYKVKDKDKLEVEPTDFSFFYDELSTCWEPNLEYRIMFVKNAQNAIEQKLCTQGIVTINDIRNLFDLPPIRDGQLWGLYYNKNEDPERLGPKVDLGVYEIDDYGRIIGKNKRTKDFVDGVEQGVLINPENIVYILDKFV